MAFGHEMHRALIRNFIDAIENGGQLRVKGDDALNAHRFIDAVLLAGTVVKQGPGLHRWPDPPSAASGGHMSAAGGK